MCLIAEYVVAEPVKRTHVHTMHPSPLMAKWGFTESDTEPKNVIIGSSSMLFVIN